MKLNVNEIFLSIQGESTRAGLPCAFIRLAGCNLRCSWCDTRYAYDEGEPVEIARIIERVSVFGCRLVEITGGEPLVQEATSELVHSLLDHGYTVLLETNGSLGIGTLDPRCHRIVDVKCPSSGMADRNNLSNLEKLTGRDELKFVIGTREDYDFANLVLTRAHPHLDETGCIINFSPLFGTIPPRTLAEWILKDHLPVRLNLQLHKYIWDPEARGV